MDTIRSQLHEEEVGPAKYTSAHAEANPGRRYRQGEVERRVDGSQLESAHATEELLERYARLSPERDELAVKVAELKRELASHLPADAPPSRRRIALLWLAVALASTITLGVVVASAATLAGFWDPLGNDATPTSLAVPALPPPLVEPSSAKPQPAPAPARGAVAAGRRRRRRAEAA